MSNPQFFSITFNSQRVYLFKIDTLRVVIEKFISYYSSQVQTKLQNPTQYYIKQQQKRQVREYLTSQQLQKNHSVISAPSALQSSNFSTNFSSNFQTSVSHLSPNSPDTTSSVASGSEVS